jgi:hypothetical protein
MAKTGLIIGIIGLIIFIFIAPIFWSLMGVA